jgi:hypothetical protein
VATQILIGKGTKFAHSATQAGTYVDIPQTFSVTGPSLSTGVIEQVHLLSLFKVKRNVLPDPGEVVVRIFYDPTDTEHGVIRTSWSAGTKRWYKLTLVSPDDGTTLKGSVNFEAIVTAFPLDDVQNEQNVTMPVTLTLTSMPTFA